jgi:hypothetical protein
MRANPRSDWNCFMTQVLRGTTADQARTLVGAMNEMILGVIVTPNG